jgi:uncharacterized membrane protein YdcZ (DUF606 family)
MDIWLRIKPWRPIATWFFIVGLFSVFYYFGNVLVNTNTGIGCIYYCVVTAATPGYGGSINNRDYFKE